MATSILFIAVYFLAYANGANDNFKNVAALVGIGLYGGKADAESIALSRLLTLPSAALCSIAIYTAVAGI